MRCALQAIRVLGVLGALDPYRHKVHLGQIGVKGDSGAVFSMSETKPDSDMGIQRVNFHNEIIIMSIITGAQTAGCLLIVCNGYLDLLKCKHDIVTSPLSQHVTSLSLIFSSLSLNLVTYLSLLCHFFVTSLSLLCYFCVTFVSLLCHFFCIHRWHQFEWVAS